VREFFDTSALVAAFWGDHPYHQASLRRFAQAARGNSACGAYSVAEVYSVLTRLPVRPAIPPEQAWLLVEQIENRLALVTLTVAEYIGAIRRAAGQGLAGGRIYDALLLSCARKVRAETIYTWNLAYFQRIAPDLSERMRTP
jgi:predicted nucleic acid-binding protein